MRAAAIFNTLRFPSLLFLLVRVQVQADHAPLRGLDRNLQQLDPSCQVIGFTVYTFNPNGEVASTNGLFSSTLDMTDFNLGKTNIAAEITEGCQPRCVKLTFPGVAKKERRSPYTLYGETNGKVNKRSPKKSGRLKACLYTDRACTQGEQGCYSMKLEVIPANTPLKAGPLTIDPFTVAFDGADGGPATQKETTAAASALCETIRSYWSYGAFYKSDVRVEEFVCSGQATANAKTLSIAFATTATVEKSTGFNPYTNSLLPDADELYESMTTFLINNWSIGPNAPTAIDEFIANLGDESSPYSTVTSFIVS